MTPIALWEQNHNCESSQAWPTGDGHQVGGSQERREGREWEEVLA